MRKLVEPQKAIAFSCRLLGGVAALALAVPAAAQDASAQGVEESDAETILVTGSRIDRVGFEAPTPTTVIGEAELRQAGRDNVAEVLADIPQVRFTNNPVTNVGGAGASGTASVDMRGLGLPRTLTLLNGHRFVGESDLASIPFSVVKRIDVVTGGASAAWGSGAVAGVINVILNDSFDGLELSAQAGISGRGDGEQYQLGGMGGVNFADGRGNLMVAVDYLDSPGIGSRNSRPNMGRVLLSGNQFYRNASLNNTSRGGLIRSGALAGQAFNPDGTLGTFQVGTVILNANNQPTANSVGADGPAQDDVLALTGSTDRLNIFGRASYELADWVRLSGDVRFSRLTGANSVLAETVNLTGASAVSRDNPFLPAAVRNSIPATQTTFQFSRFLADDPVSFDFERDLLQGTISLDGRFGGGWRWDAYYSHGEVVADTAILNQRITTNFAAAVDVVAGPGGQPVCRSVATLPACVPLNLFGEGRITPEARAFAFGEARIYATTKLDVAAASLRGEPFSTWAGTASIAVGGEIRKESLDQTVNDLAANQRLSVTNPRPLVGSFSVKEAFAEILLPLARDLPLLNLLEFNGALRVSDYSTSGTIWSWKLGLTNQVFDGLRLRGTYSRDIRAPNITELFTTLTTQVPNITDPANGNASYQIQQFSSGNPLLEPEESKTMTAGLVFDPSFIPGLSVSVDYYDISIRGAIGALGAQQTINRCFTGNAVMCSRIVRGGANNNVISVQNPQFNYARFETNGVDMELVYRTGLTNLNLPGRMNFRVLANYVDKLIQDDGVVRLDSVANVGGGGVPHWRGVASMTYQLDDTTIDLRARYVGGGKFNNTSTTIIGNDIDARVYVDLGFQFGVPINGDDGGRFTFFGSVANLFDRDPPLLPNAAIYDVIGRYFNVGARVRF